LGHEWALKKCGQWMLLQKPHVISNSWGGGQGKTIFNDMIRAWRLAGIIPVIAIGSSGPNCGSENSPGDQPNLISVGATDKYDQVISKSSRGLTANKPEISATGNSVYSSYFKSNSSYQHLSGTSSAASHVTGAIALMLSRNPQLKFDEIMESLQKSADRPQVGYPASTIIGGSYLLIS
jgi:subtilisin family serine protease